MNIKKYATNNYFEGMKFGDIKFHNSYSGGMPIERARVVFPNSNIQISLIRGEGTYSDDDSIEIAIINDKIDYSLCSLLLGSNEDVAAYYPMRKVGNLLKKVSDYINNSN